LVHFVVLFEASSVLRGRHRNVIFCCVAFYGWTYIFGTEHEWNCYTGWIKTFRLLTSFSPHFLLPWPYLP